MSFFCSKIRGEKACFAFLPADFREKERLLIVQSLHSTGHNVLIHFFALYWEGNLPKIIAYSVELTKQPLMINHKETVARMINTVRKVFLSIKSHSR